MLVGRVAARAYVTNVQTNPPEAGAAASPGSAARAAIPFQLVEWLGRSMSHKSYILR